MKRVALERRRGGEGRALGWGVHSSCRIPSHENRRGLGRLKEWLQMNDERNRPSSAPEDKLIAHYVRAEGKRLRGVSRNPIIKKLKTGQIHQQRPLSGDPGFYESINKLRRGRRPAAAEAPVEASTYLLQPA